MSPARARRRDPERDRLLAALAAAVAAHPRSTMYELTLLVTTAPGPAPDDGPGDLLGSALPAAGPKPITCALAAELLKELERTGRVRCVKTPEWRWEPTG